MTRRTGRTSRPTSSRLLRDVRPYPAEVSTSTPTDSPILRTVLGLVGSGSTEPDLERRLAEHGLTARAGLIGETLAHATELGLIRVASTGPSGPRRVLTSLGQRLVGHGAVGSDEADRLRDLESLRTDLSATIAHELRTPLTAIRTCAGLLLSEDANPTPEQHRTLVETIERNAERMQRVVGDILDLARFRAGGINLQLRRFDAIATADAVVRSIAPVAAEREVRLEIDAPRAAIEVYGDRRRLEQALLNLISNAVRFSPATGLVAVTVGQRGSVVSWTVRDDGPGIPVPDQARLFERFFVGRSDLGGPRDGVGLGLPTALAIAQAHGGRIDVESAPGAGSTFALVVPLDGPPDDEPV